MITSVYFLSMKESRKVVNQREHPFFWALVSPAGGSEATTGNTLRFADLQAMIWFRHLNKSCL